MQYALIDSEKIYAGPRDWNYGIFMSALAELGVSQGIPLAYSGSDPIQVGAYQIVSVADIAIPTHDATYEQLAGPNYRVQSGNVIGEYSVVGIPLESIKNALIAQVLDERIKKENAGTKVTLQGQEVSVDTDGTARNLWMQSFFLLPDNGTQSFKFPKESIWLDLSKADIGLVVQAIMTHIQAAYQYEEQKTVSIQSAVDVDSLKLIDIKGV